MHQALATKYNLYLSRRKYTFYCKIQKSTFDSSSQEWNSKCISYGEYNILLCEKPISDLSIKKFVDSLNIGDINYLSGYCGAFRTLTALTTMVIDLHMKSPYLRKKLVWYNDIINHFIIEFSDDGAPETRDITMCIGSISCWNFGHRIRSREYHYPLHTISTKEKDEIVGMLWRQYSDEMMLLEGNIIHVNGEKITMGFQPSADQDWQFWANNELTLSATYPSMFAKVHKNQLADIGGTLGTSEDCTWQVPTIESRKNDLDLLNVELCNLEPTGSYT